MPNDDAKLREYLNRVMTDLRQTRGRLQAVEAKGREPIAIVGMGCRFPGDVNSPEDLWDLVAAGRNVVSSFPENRGWDLEALYDPDPGRPGTSYTRHGGFLEEADRFDASLFGISPREALVMDPQQRLLMETSWEVFERAGIAPTSLAGTSTGVFVGSAPSGYGSGAQDVPDESEGYALAGVTPAIASGRIAYAFGLEGPAVTVDTACSSSLVALHLACQALRQDECSLALAGAVTVLALPTLFVEFSRQRGLATDGLCKAFAAAADGTGFSEGVGLLLLERLSDAQRNGHQILAVVRGSAINQDGASNGLTAPNGPSQQRVVRQALANARLTAADVDAVEAHGTGTTLGDPIEAQALLATYGQDRPEDRPLWLGSIKSNIGHTEAAAGVAGVIKMVMAMRHGRLPQTLHVDEPTPHVDWSAGNVSLLTEPMDWPDTGRPRRAGVSSFGASGTNAHVILEQAPPPEAVAKTSADAAVLPWMLSGKSPEALRAQAARLRAHLDRSPGTDPADVAFSLATTRAALDHRGVVLARDLTEAMRGLDILASGDTAPGVLTGTARPRSGVVFVFPGQGSQWAGMGRDLLDTSPVFAEHIAETEKALAPYVDWSLTEVLRGHSYDRVDVVQPALFAIMVSLARLWQHHGIQPDAVIGHSQGEIAAAHVAGALTLHDACRIIAQRSKALLPLTGHGGMLAIATTAEHATELIEPFGAELSIASINGPNSTVIAGTPTAVQQLQTACDVHARLIPVDYASHSPQVETIQDQVLSAAEGIQPQPTVIPLYSTVTTQPINGTDLTPEYWYQNLRQTVRFEQTINTLLADGHHHFIEASPHPVLTIGIEEATTATVTPTLHRDQGDPHDFRTGLAHAWANGLPVDWRPQGRTTDLPTYPFQHQRYWLQPTSGAIGNASALGLKGADHPLLGAAVNLATEDGVLLTGRLSTETLPWIADHSVAGTVLLPGAAFVELALRAGDEVGYDRVEELTLENPLALHNAVQIQLSLGIPDEAERRTLSIHARPAGQDEAPWTRHATGILTTATTSQPDITAWPPPGAEPIATGDENGPAWRLGDDIYAEVSLPEHLHDQADHYGIHPALLDTALYTADLGDFFPEEERLRMPFAWNGVELHAVGASSLRVRISSGPSGELTITTSDATGRTVLSVESLVTRPVPAERPRVAPAAGDNALPRRASSRRTAESAAHSGDTALARRLAGRSTAEQTGILIELVRTNVATVLGHATPEAIDSDQAFKDLGFDSLTSVGLRDRLSSATGLRLPATLTFDYPTPTELAQHLLGQALGTLDGSAIAPPVRTAAADDPLAIVSMACRFPGDVQTPENLWQVVVDGRDVVSGFPTDRGWDLDGLDDPDPDHPGTSYTSQGGFLYDAGQFDPQLFGISPREALAMDPQQRLLLEASWEVFERAGIDPTSLKGTRTGVFAGAIASGYATGLAELPEGVQGYMGTGIAASVLSGRVSYAFGLEGPAVTVDTACSSSLVALHLACQALRQGECTMALAAGVTVIAVPAVFTEFSRQRGLAADGRCKSFAAAADGTGFSEGVGVLLVERLSDARRNGHRVLALVRGSAVNQDGASNGLTAPNGPAQQRVIHQALANARLTAADVDAVEAHGTGTTLGDPIEAQAVQATYGQDRPDDRPLWLGSIKSNIGHPQAAAGVAGVIKMVMAMRHGRLPQTLHVDEPSPHVDWSAGNVSLLTEPMDWPDIGRPRRAGVSSFGVSGTNAHVILEQAPRQEESESSGDAPAPWVLSGKTPQALRAQARRLQAYAAEHADLPLTDVALALATGRAAHEHRTAVIGTDHASILKGLAAVADGTASPYAVESGKATTGKTVFVFPGQGSQWVGMGRELLNTSPVFAEHIAECEKALAPYVDWSLTEVLNGHPYDRVDVVQPTLFAVMVCLARLWQHHGIQPDAVIGHSQGEIAAAHIAGALTLHDAAQIITQRSKALQALTGHGGMLAIATTPEHATELIEPFGAELSIASINGPEAIVVSGTPTALDQLQTTCSARTRRIPVDYASHSPQVETIHDHVLSAAEGISPQPTTVPLYSTVTTQPIDGTELTPEYWYQNLRRTVRFEQTVQTLIADGHHHFIESSPHPVLTIGIEETTTTATATPTLHRDQGDLSDLHANLARAWTHGLPVAWTTVLGNRPTHHVDLPTYAFQRNDFWLRSGSAFTSGTAVSTEAEDAEAATALARDLVNASETGREAILVELVRTSTAAVLGHESADTVDMDSAFKELGFDSLTAVQLRNRLNAATGLRLPATLVFNHTNPKALGEYLATILRPEEQLTDSLVLRDITMLEDSLRTQPYDEETRGRITMRLDMLLRNWRDGFADVAIDGAPGPDAVDADDLAAATDDEIFKILDDQLGSS